MAAEMQLSLVHADICIFFVGKARFTLCGFVVELQGMSCNEKGYFVVESLKKSEDILTKADC